LAKVRGSGSEKTRRSCCDCDRTCLGEVAGEKVWVCELCVDSGEVEKGQLNGVRSRGDVVKSGGVVTAMVRCV
jgi:hypothetical protein